MHTLEELKLLKREYTVREIDGIQWIGWVAIVFNPEETSLIKKNDNQQYPLAANDTSKGNTFAGVHFGISSVNITERKDGRYEMWLERSRLEYAKERLSKKKIFDHNFREELSR